MLQHKHINHIKPLNCEVGELVSLGMLYELKWLYEHNASLFSDDSLATAIENNWVDVAGWLYDTFPKSTFRYPSGGCGDFPKAKWVVETYQWKPSRSLSFYGCGQDREKDESIFFEKFNRSSSALV